MLTLTKLENPKYWLLAIAVTLATLHLGLLSQNSEAENVFSMSILFWLAIASLVWDKKDNLKLNSDLFSSICGFLLIILVLLRSLSPAGYDPEFSPFISIFGLCLLASGFKGLLQYWKEFIILGLLVIYPILSILLQSIDIPTITTQFSTFLLWITGYPVSREGTFIVLPTGRVEVYGACSGIDSILQMLNISVLFLLIIPTKTLQKFISIILAIILGFMVNSARVSLLTILVSSGQIKAFEYWHGGDGSLIFSMVSVGLFGLFCWFFFLRDRNVNLTPKS